MLNEYRERYRTHLLGNIAPFWLRHSPDPAYGGSFSCLDRTGAVYDTRKYVWLMGRAAWMFSRLYNTVERRPDWLEAARQNVEFLRRHGRDPHGRCYFSLTREGAPAFFQRKPYAAVFVMLGLLEYARTGAGEPYLSEAVELYRRIREWIADPTLLGRPAAGNSQLADLMVAISMTIELIDAYPEDPFYRKVLQESVEAAFRHRVESGTMVENIALDGSSLRHLPEGRLTCPGHVTEVAWFLLQALERAPNPAREREALAVLEASLASGWDARYGGLYYFQDIEGKPPQQLEANMKLWWPHTEAIYAVILAYKKTGEKKWLDWLDKLDQYAFSHFADPEHGEWWGYCDRRGEPIHHAKGGNYKGFFHVPRFLLFSVQALED